jgi:hypothetical protein
MKMKFKYTNIWKTSPGQSHRVHDHLSVSASSPSRIAFNQ